MKKIGVIFTFTWICLFSIQGITAPESQLTINILDQKKSGVIYLTICRDAIGFENSVENESDENSCRTVSISSEAKETLEVTTDIPDGDYAIALFVDTNGNNKIDKNFIGIPKEQYGFSNDAMGQMKGPSYEQAKFIVSGDTTHNITLKSGISR